MVLFLYPFSVVLVYLLYRNIQLFFTKLILIVSCCSLIWSPVFWSDYMFFLRLHGTFMDRLQLALQSDFEYDSLTMGLPMMLQDLLAGYYVRRLQTQVVPHTCKIGFFVNKIGVILADSAYQQPSSAHNFSRTTNSVVCYPYVEI